MIPTKYAFKLLYAHLPYKWHNTTPTTRNTLVGGNNTIKGKNIFTHFFRLTKLVLGQYFGII